MLECSWLWDSRLLRIKTIFSTTKRVSCKIFKTCLRRRLTSLRTRRDPSAKEKSKVTCLLTNSRLATLAMLNNSKSIKMTLHLVKVANLHVWLALERKYSQLSVQPTPKGTLPRQESTKLCWESCSHGSVYSQTLKRESNYWLSSKCLSTWRC